MAKRPPRKKKLIGKGEEIVLLTETIIEDRKINLNKEKIKKDILMSDIGLGLNEIHCGDTCETMGKLKDGSIDLIHFLGRRDQQFLYLDTQIE
jgi:hypothetical protein